MHRIYVDGNPVEGLPQLTVEEKLRNATTRLTRFWNTSLRKFWLNVYIRYRDELYSKKAGKLTAPSNPASDNHDDPPAA